MVAWRKIRGQVTERLPVADSIADLKITRMAACWSLAAPPQGTVRLHLR